MKLLTPLAPVLLAVAAMLNCANAHAQARGASAKETLEHGQQIESIHRGPNKEALARELGLDPELLASGQLLVVPGRGLVLRRGREEFELAKLRPPQGIDAVTRARKLAEHEIWLRRLPGRFRIGGQVDKKGLVTTGSARMPESPTGAISGVADCVGVGEGAGVQCLINATWPVIEAAVATPGGPVPPSELLRTFGPAALVLGTNPDTGEIRVLLVTDESLAYILTGGLTGNTLGARLQDPGSCIPRIDLMTPRCFSRLEIVAEPDSESLQVNLQANGLTIRFNMRRDPEARAEKPVKRKKVR